MKRRSIPIRPRPEPASFDAFPIGTYVEFVMGPHAGKSGRIHRYGKLPALPNLGDLPFVLLCAQDAHHGADELPVLGAHQIAVAMEPAPPKSQRPAIKKRGRRAA
jgi:hypothetical protein